MARIHLRRRQFAGLHRRRTLFHERGRVLDADTEGPTAARSALLWARLATLVSGPPAPSGRFDEPVRHRTVGLPRAESDEAIADLCSANFGSSRPLASNSA